MSDPISTPESAVRWIESDRDVHQLAGLVRDPARERPIIGVTVQPQLAEPMLDVRTLAADLAGRADVWVISNPPHQWLLTELLPEGIDVYGGAIRAWGPIPEGADVSPRDHPKFNVFSLEDADRAVRDILGYVTGERAPDPKPGDDVMATVTAVQPNGAEVTLETGHFGFVANSHMADNAQIFHAQEAVREGQKVRVRVSDDINDEGRDRLRVSMRPHAPDPWKRVMEVYKEGAIVEAIILRPTQFGVFAELLPGAEGLIHKSRIANAFVEHPGDYVQEGERTLVRILSIDRHKGRAELSLVDVPKNATPEPVPSLYPDGPPWLPVFGDQGGPAAPGDGGGSLQDPGPGVPGERSVSDDPRDADTEVIAALEELDARIAEVEGELDALLQERDELIAQLPE